MTIRRETYDTRCYDLAMEWLNLEDNFADIKPELQEKLRHRLAGDIQGAVEDFDRNVAEIFKDFRTTIQIARRAQGYKR